MPFIAIAWRDQILMHHHHRIHSSTSAGNTSHHLPAKLYTRENTQLLTVAWSLYLIRKEMHSKGATNYNVPQCMQVVQRAVAPLPARLCLVSCIVSPHRCILIIGIL